jgi:hypothetical protein
VAPQDQDPEQPGVEQVVVQLEVAQVVAQPAAAVQPDRNFLFTINS